MKALRFAVVGVLPLAAALPSWLGLASRQAASTITVDLTKTYQTMDGFGVRQSFHFKRSAFFIFYFLFFSEIMICPGISLFIAALEIDSLCTPLFMFSTVAIPNPKN